MKNFYKPIKFVDYVPVSGTDSGNLSVGGLNKTTTPPISEPFYPTTQVTIQQDPVNTDGEGIYIDDGVFGSSQDQNSITYKPVIETPINQQFIMPEEFAGIEDIVSSNQAYINAPDKNKFLSDIFNNVEKYSNTQDMDGKTYTLNLYKLPELG